MRKYEELEMEVVEFDAEDVIATSQPPACDYEYEYFLRYDQVCPW